MKKISFALFALIGILTSCTNDDIEITHATTIRVNPSGVVAPFNVELNAGELESFGSEYKLRVRVLAYNEQGILSSQDEQFLTNYAGLANCNLSLSNGTYRVIAITDVVNNNAGADVPEYWKLSGTENLSTTRLTDAGYTGGTYKILGVASKSVNITDGENSYTLNPEPVGALCLVWMRNMLHYSGITQFDIEMNRTSDFMEFSNDGTFAPSIDNHNGDFDWILCRFDRDDSWNNLYDYYFVLPMRNVSFRASVLQDDSWLSNIAPEQTINLEAGIEYGIILDLYDTESTQTNNVSFEVGALTSSSRSVPSFKEFAGNNYNTGILYLKDINESKVK